MTWKWYLRNTTLSSGVHVAGNELEMNASVGSGPNTVNYTITKGDTLLTHLWTSPANEPNTADWPSGTYTVSIDVSAAGADLTYGPCSVTGGSGHLATVNSGLTSDVVTNDHGTAESGTGIKTFAESWDPASGSASDRAEILITCYNDAHQDQDLTIRTEDSDSYLDTPILKIKSLSTAFSGNGLITARLRSDPPCFAVLDNKVLRISAEYVETTGSDLDKFYDLWNNNDLANPTTNAPQYVVSGLNNEPIVQFRASGPNAIEGGFTALTQPFTVMCLVKRQGWGDTQAYIFNGNDIDHEANAYYSQTNQRLSINGISQVNYGEKLKEWKIYTIVYNGTSWRWYLDGVEQVSLSDVGSEVLDGFIIGGRTLYTFNSDIDVAELLVVDDELTTTEIDNIVDFWEEKYSWPTNYLRVNITASGSMTADVTIGGQTQALVAAITSTSTFGALLGKLQNLTAAVTSSGIVTADLSATIPLAAAVTSSGTVTAKLLYTDRFWNSSASTDWSIAANWTDETAGSDTATVPQTHHDVYFNAATSNVDCTLTTAGTCKSLIIGTSGSLYTGTFDADTYSMVIGDGGLDCTYGGSAELDIGDGAWQCTGNWDSQDIGTLTKGAGSITFNGGNDQNVASDTSILNDITINKSAGRVTLTTDIYTDSFTFVDGDLDVNGYTIYSDGNVDIQGNNGARFWNGVDSDMGGGIIDIDSGSLLLTGSA